MLETPSAALIIATRPGNRRLNRAPVQWQVPHFHCTDGVDFVLDGTGGRPRSLQLDLGAEAAAAHLSRGFPASFDGSGWVVAVHDSLGQQVAVIPFPPRL